MAVAYANLGNALAAQGKRDEAIKSYWRAIVLDPGQRIAHNGLGSLLDDQGRLDEAVESYRRAIDADPKHAAAPHFNLGNLLLRQRKLEIQLSEWERRP